MADTQRTISDLLTTIFHDGQTASITANALRDLIVTLQPQYGSSFFTNNTTETDVITAGVYIPIIGVAGTDASSSDITVANGRMTYTGAEPRHFFTVGNLSMTAASNGKVIALKFAKNGVVMGAPVERYISNGSDIGAAGLTCDVTLDTNDYLEIWGTNLTDTTNFTIKSFSFFGTGGTL